LVAHNTLAVAEQQKSAVDQLRNIASTFGNLDEMKKNQQAMDAFRKVATKFNIPNFSGSREEFVTLDTNIHGS
jgi:hypothetical protein